MKEERPRNLAASVKARLRAVAQREQKAFDEVFLLYLQERMLHRLGRVGVPGKVRAEGRAFDLREEGEDGPTDPGYRPAGVRPDQ